LLGGVVGTLWTAMRHAGFFAVLALIAAAASAALRACDALEQQVQRARDGNAVAA
jgi:hypothetical protein